MTTTEMETTEDLVTDDEQVTEVTGNVDTGATEDEQTGEPETFPRAYVEQLREEAADYRVRARRSDELGQRLHSALVTATGRLADPTDLVYAEAHLEDEAALTTAIDELLGRKPHLAARRVSGRVRLV